MPVPSAPTNLDQRVHRGVELRYDLIRARAAEKLNITAGEVTLKELATLLDLSLKQVWRFSKGIAMPSARTANHMAEVLGIPVGDFIKPTDGAR